MQRALDVIERVGNKVPNPVLMFLYLNFLVIILSTILAWAGVSVTEQIAEPVPYPVQHNYYEDTTEVQSQVPAQGNEYLNVTFEIRQETIPVRSLLTVEGIRFIFTSFVANFQNFGVIAVVFIAMMGAGVAEGVELLNVLIRKLVELAPRRLITFLIILVGGLASIATDAGYLILIPLAASVFFRLRRNPLAGLAAGFAGVGVTFGVNLIIQPTDAMITEIANEAITLTGGRPISVVSNFYFSAVSLIILCVVATFITERMIEPRLCAYDFASPEAIEVGVAEAAGGQRGAGGAEDASGAEVRGLGSPQQVVIGSKRAQIRAL
jgi:aminobenzoyl-glutamate transport protein